MTYRRFLVADASVDVCGMGFLSAQHVLSIDGRTVWQAMLDDSQMATLDAFPGTVLRLETPASKIPLLAQQWFASHGVSIEADDTALNLLRKLRDALGISFASLRIEGS